MNRRTLSAAALVLLGAFLNPWTLGWLFASRGYLERPAFLAVLALGGATITMGFVLYVKGDAIREFYRALHSRRLLRWGGYAIYSTLAVLLISELGLRLYSARELGTHYLFYGTRFHFKEGQEHRNVARFDGSARLYYKYGPNQRIRDTDKETGEYFSPTINSWGFRGREYATSKPPNVYRIVAPGASSTFGFHNRDDETYPSYLEDLLNRHAPDTVAFEVINMGIAHNTSAMNLQLLRAEVVPLNPDLVTFYEGVNDTVVRRSLWWLRLKARLLTAVFAEKAAGRHIEGFGREDIRRHRAERSTAFIKNLDAMADLCAQRGIRFVPITQQATSLSIPFSELAGISYEQEYAAVVGALDRRLLNTTEMSFVLHHSLMDTMRTWAAARHLPLIDGITALDETRDELTSWVHLSAKGNQLLAAHMADSLHPIIFTDAN